MLYVVCMSRFVTNMTYAYISAKNKDNDMKLSEYDPWGLPSTSITSLTTLGLRELYDHWAEGPPKQPSAGAS